jgi:hypothetical protein
MSKSSTEAVGSSREGPGHVSEKKVGGAAGFARWTIACANQNGSNVTVGRG